MKQKDTIYISVKKSSILYWSKVIVLGVLLGTGLQFAGAWSEPGPGVIPPDGNVAGPITTSSVPQTKSGRLILSSDLMTQLMVDLNNNFVVDPSSTSTFSTVRADIYYDRQTPSYYLDPGNTSNTNRMQAQTICLGGVCRTTWPSGGGAGDNLGNHIATTNLNMNNNNIGNISTSYHVRGVASADFRAPVFYDTDNTGYYVNPAQTSNFNLLNVRGSTINLGSEGSKIVRSDASNWTSFQSASGHALVAYDNGRTDLRHGGSAKIRTENYGVFVIGKARSSSTSSGDPGNTLATKDYVDAQSGGGGCYVSTPTINGGLGANNPAGCIAGFTQKGTYTCGLAGAAYNRPDNAVYPNRQATNGTCRVCCQ